MKNFPNALSVVCFPVIVRNMSGQLLLILLVGALSSIVKPEDTHYLITSPSKLRESHEETFGVQVFGSKSCRVALRVTLEGTNIISTTNKVFKPGEPGKLTLQIPNYPQDRFMSRYNLYAAVCGVKTRTILIDGIRQKLHNLYIQTDKPIYKPGQKIRIRIIALDKDLKPSGDMPLETVHVVVSSSRIMQWNNVSLQDGLASLELQLSKEPVLGNYVITATGYETKKTLAIVVDKFVEPKFEVKVEPPSYMALDQKEFTTSICARYSYGGDVKGKLNAVLCLKHRHWRDAFERCHNITKEMQGCAQITLSRESLNAGSIKNPNSTVFEVVASVTEPLREITITKQARVDNFLSRSVKMSFGDTLSKFKPGLPFEYVIKVTRPDGSPITGANVQVKISRGYRRRYFYIKTFIVENGLIKDTINHTRLNRPLQFRAKLLDPNPYPIATYRKSVTQRFQSRPKFSPSFSFLEILRTQTVPAKIDSQASLTVRYTVRKDTGKRVDFHYLVMCKRNLVLTGKYIQYHDYLQENTTTKDRNLYLEKFNIKFAVTSNMVPSCHVIVYYVRNDKEVVADSLNFDVQDLKNKVSISFEDSERKPGEKTKLILKSTPGSRVAFVAVDKRVHRLKPGNELSIETIRPLLRIQGTFETRNPNARCFWGTNYEDAADAFNDAGVRFLSSLNVNTRPCPRPPSSGFDCGFFRSTPCRPFWGGLWGRRRRAAYFPGHFSLLNSNWRSSQSRKTVEDKRSAKRKRKIKEDKASLVRVHKEFPETWLWADEKLDESGNKTIQVILPKTITKWVANGFSMSSTAGLGISEAAIIRSFQQFFVQMSLPYSVIRGEEIPVIVTVFNHMDGCAPIKLELKYKSQDYKVTSYHISKLCVCADAAKSAQFTLIPTKLGRILLTVAATTSSSVNLCPNSSMTASDTVTRSLLVEPEGISKEHTQGTFLCPGSGEHQEEFDLKVPKHVVPGSVYPTVTVIGDVLGPALRNLESLLRMPEGCGEQNMARFAKHIYVMDYLTKSHQVTEDIKNNAKINMEKGYQQALTYQNKNGSYSLFGKRDEDGNMMLTAFLVRSFARAKRYIFIDEQQIKDSLQWISNKQKKNGCFPQYGRFLNANLQGGVNSEITITAYVTTALLEAKKSTDSLMVSKALSCITSQLNVINDSYTMALVTYTLTLANHTDAEKMMALLMKRAIKKAGQMYWTNENKRRESGNYYRSSAEVEMTAYALLAIINQSHDKFHITDEVMGIIRWLSKQRNSNGGFASSQDTFVALQALSEFAGKTNVDFKPSELTGSLKMGNYFNHSFLVTKGNRFTLQSVELPAKMIPGKLQVTGHGSGCALIQASVKYNVPEPEDVPAFDIKVQIRVRRSAVDEVTTPCSPLRLNITTKWLKNYGSNMAVVDVKLVTGFSVREDSLEKLRNDTLLNFKRYDVDGQNVMLYFDEIKNISFSIDIHQDTLVKKLKPAVVKVYDYYEPENQAKVMYRIGEAECYGNKISMECPRCMTLDHPETLIENIVHCNSTVTRMKSLNGMLKVIETYSEDFQKVLKKEFEYQIPEFCPCEEIYDNQVAIVFGQNSYFKVNGEETMVVLNSGTTLLKWTGPSMKSHIRMIKKILAACKGIE